MARVGVCLLVDSILFTSISREGACALCAGIYYKLPPVPHVSDQCRRLSEVDFASSESSPALYAQSFGVPTLVFSRLMLGGNQLPNGFSSMEKFLDFPIIN